MRLGGLPVVPGLKRPDLTFADEGWMRHELEMRPAYSTNSGLIVRHLQSLSRTLQGAGPCGAARRGGGLARYWKPSSASGVRVARCWGRASVVRLGARSPPRVVDPFDD